jgi:aryl-alcohol dehydrogenase-like predicted oxidoreductase
MEYTTLGDTGLEISRLCLGCMNFGSGEPWMIGDAERSQKILDRALEHGINFLDTANVYSHGESEEIADAKDATPAQVSLAWLLHKDVVDAPIVGPRRMDHLEESVAALDVSLDPSELQRIEEPITPRWPAPGKD